MSYSCPGQNDIPKKDLCVRSVVYGVLLVSLLPSFAQPSPYCVIPVLKCNFVILLYRD